MIQRSGGHHFLKVAVTREGTPQGKTRLGLLSSPFCLSLLLSGNYSYAWFFPGRMHTQVHDKHWVTQNWLCHCLQLRIRPAGQRLYLDFFRVSWHHGIQFALAPALQLSPPLNLDPHPSALWWHCRLFSLCPHFSLFHFSCAAPWTGSKTWSQGNICKGAILT